MGSYTRRELIKLKRLQAEIYDAVPHSKEAVAIGRQIREIDQKAYLRRRATITPAQDMAMRELGERLSIS